MTTRPITHAVRDDRAAIDKAISLLVSFRDQANTGVGVSELARRADLNKSTAFRVLGILERNGVVERVGTSYRLGPRLHELSRGAYTSDHEALRDMLIPFVADVYERTHETTHLAVLVGADVLYLAKLYGYRRIRSPSRIGGRAPAYCTAVGKILLAYDSDAAATAAATLRPFTSHTVTDAAALSLQLARVRRDGIAFDDEEIQRGLSCVAVPIFGPAGCPVAALSIAGATGSIDIRRHVPTLRRVAAAAGQMFTESISKNTRL
ncbi:IclR family transcriptional regulator [Nocardia lijiangensis]|uniref:IclR family transcriptional regulator n=1 Tax=Nocardia lijiangensis TaxID=299618 RepID=UPI00082A8C93|nr:IclR family transcriptional regulator [Nocardia lijiangensis]